MTTIEKIRHYQRAIQDPNTKPKRLIYCIQKLASLPVNIQHLQDTGIGRSVNALRKIGDGVGETARSLVATWKEMVIAQPSDEDEACVPDAPESYESPSPNNEVDVDRARVAKTGGNKAPSPDSTSKYPLDDWHPFSNSPNLQNEDSEVETVCTIKNIGQSQETDVGQTHFSDEIKENHWKQRYHSSKLTMNVIKEQEPSSSNHIESDTVCSDTEELIKKTINESVDTKLYKSKKTSLSKEKKTLNEKTKDKHKSREKHHHRLKDEKSSSSKSSKEKSNDSIKGNCDEILSESSKLGKPHRDKNDHKSETLKQRCGNKSKIEKKHCDDKLKHRSREKRKKVVEEGIDGNSGRSFGEALGMCVMPPPAKKKKELHKPIANSSLVKNESTNCCESQNTLPLLSSKTKLAPLNPDISVALPEINPNYKPLPIAYSNSLQYKPEEEHKMGEQFSAKNTRTKVYSGKAVNLGAVPSLQEIVIKWLTLHINELGKMNMPYSIIKPVLERATSAQLLEIEFFNPELIEDSDELWQIHCDHQFKTAHRLEEETWRELFMRCLEEREEKFKKITENIKQARGNSAPVRSTKLAYVDNIAKPPRNILRKQVKYGTGNAPSVKPVSDVKKKLIESCTTSNVHSASSSSGSTIVTSNISVPVPLGVRMKQAQQRKSKAPLMAKTLQAIKNSRFKR